MERNTSKESVQEGLQTRDLELYQEERVDLNLQSNRQLQESKEPTQSVLKQNFLQLIEEKEHSHSELKEETDANANAKQEVENSAENPLVPITNLMQIRLEADAEQKCELADDKILETEGNITTRQITEYPEILIVPAQNSMPTAEHYSNDAAQTRTWQLETNEALQQNLKLSRNLSIISSEKQDLQKPFEISKKNEKEQNIVMQQKSATPEEISERPAEATATQYGTQNQEPMQKVLSKGLDDFFKNHGMMQQRTESPAKLPRDSTSIAELGSNDAKQEWNKIANIEHLKALQQIGELSRKFSILGSKKEGLQQESAILDKPSKTLSEATKTQFDAQDKRMQKKQELRIIIADYFEKNKVNLQVTETCNQKYKLDVFNSKELKPQISTEALTYEEPEGNRNGNPRELGENLIKWRSESGDDMLARSQKPGNDASGYHGETGEIKKMEHGAIVPAGLYDCKHEHHKSSKNYVTFHKQLSGQITVCPKKTKDYVTSRHQEPIETERFSKSKDYVTLAPRKPHNVAMSSKLSKHATPDSESKDYVTREPIKQETKRPPQPPTHIFWPVRRFQENPSDPGSSPQSLQKPELEEPKPRVPLGTQQVQGRKRPRQIHFPRSQRLSSIPEDDEFQLVPLEEMCAETIMQTNEPVVPRNRRILRLLIPPLLSGIQDLIQRFRESYIAAEKRGFFKKLCRAFFFCLLAGGFISVALYFTIPLIISKLDIGGSNFTSALYNSHLNSNISVTDQKHFSQSESLDGKVSTSETRLVGSNVDFTLKVAGYDFNTTYSSVDLDAEIIPAMNDVDVNLNAFDINSESSVSTLVTNLDVKLIDFTFGVTAPVNVTTLYIS